MDSNRIRNPKVPSFAIYIILLVLKDICFFSRCVKARLTCTKVGLGVLLDAGRH